MASQKRGATDFYLLLEEYNDSDISSDNVIQNGHIVFIFFKEKKNKVKAIDFFTSKNENINKGALRAHMRKIITEVESYKKCLSNETQWTSLKQLLCQKYSLPVSSSPASRPNPTPLTPVSPNMNHLPSASPSSFSTPKRKLRSDCQTCEKRRQLLVHASARYSTMKESIRKAKQRLTRNKQLQQKVVRKEAVEAGLRKERRQLRRKLKCLQDASADSSLRREIQTLKRLLRSRNEELGRAETKISDLSAKLSSLQREVRQLEEANDYLLSVVNDSESETSDVDETASRHYGMPMRKVIYKSLLSQVPVTHSGTLIAYALQELGNTSLKKVPHKSTIARMAFELSALSKVQAMETLMTSDCATLCWDATTLDGTHVNEMHISTPGQTFTVSIAQLPGGRAIDYFDHLCREIDELAATHAAYTGENFLRVKSSVIGKISSTMSDRAPVNHCVVQQLRTDLDMDLLELNCNLHPLDGFASHTRSALQKLDLEEGLSSYGRDCCAANFIYNISKLRYKQTGDPAGFKAFLRRHDIPQGVFVRYVGNRLHVMFHMAGAIMRFRDELKDYLERHCRTTARIDLIRAISDPRLCAQFCALGLCGKIITGPWMTLFYSNKQCLSHLQMVPHIKKSATIIDSYMSDPCLMLTTSTDVFGHRLVDDDILMCLKRTEANDTFKKCLSVILGAFQKVLQKQLRDYISGPLSDVTDEMLQLTKSASPHNIWAERSLGMADALWRRAPNASVGFLDAKVKAKTNHTLEWLDSHDAPTQQSLIQFAVKRGSYLRAAHLTQTRTATDCVQLRMMELAQCRDKKMRKTMEKGVKVALKDKDMTSSIFDPVQGKQREFLTIVVKEPHQAIGALFQHIWESNDGENVLYWGRLREFSCRKNGIFTIGYWAEGQTESSSEDYDIPSESVVADMLTKDLTFLISEALASGLIQPGLVVEEQKRTFVNNKAGMLEKCKEFSLSKMKWLQRLDLTNDPAPVTDVTMNEDSVPNDDFKREMRFHRQAQASVLEGLSKLAALSIPTKRPEDYFAEMAKSDDHMKKVRSKLLEKKLSLERSEKAKKMRELRKYGKKVQVEVLQKRQKEKKEMLDTVKKFRKGQVDKIDIFDESIQREQKSDNKQTQNNKKFKPNKKREYKNKKFGFGGQKKRSKLNTAESAADMSDFNPRKVHSKGPARKINKGVMRPGKNKRKSMKNKKK